MSRRGAMTRKSLTSPRASCSVRLSALPKFPETVTSSHICSSVRCTERLFPAAVRAWCRVPAGRVRTSPGAKAFSTWRPSSSHQDHRFTPLSWRTNTFPASICSGRADAPGPDMNTCAVVLPGAELRPGVSCGEPLSISEKGAQDNTAGCKFSSSTTHEVDPASRSPISSSGVAGKVATPSAECSEQSWMIGCRQESGLSYSASRISRVTSLQSDASPFGEV
mmetsp:Transcript_24385/g.54988  ORF Transcript_24385/g.54988 Transcript_24385/m.54988 type:complete len:222 (-) Transcript_24385:961-1626(-)